EASLSLIDLVVLLGIAAVLPLALGGAWWWWAGAAAAALGALLLPAGWAAAGLALPWVLACVAAGVAALRRAGPAGSWGLEHGAKVLACAYAAAAAGAFVLSRRGARLFGIGEPIVELTAVHYTYAGAAALVLAVYALEAASGRERRIARAAVVLTALAPPVVAVGFVTRAAVAQVGGAVLMTLGVWLTAGLQLHTALGWTERTRVRLLLAVSGFTIWIPMVLAVAWAAGQHWPVPALPIPDMVRTHGLANALGFVLCGLIGRRLSALARD
ncbi:MAG TPA: YndJ family transporter, partial [Longimicrobiaceae bacterium]|nr:YndJ family transporter [Longimicrobiaceae bacterium]